MKWPGCTGTRDEKGVSTNVSAQTQNRLHKMLAAAILRSEDECLTFSEEDLTNASSYQINLEEIKEERSYVLTLVKK